MTSIGSLPSIEVVIEDVPLPVDFANLYESQLVSVTSKDYSTVVNTWGFTVLQASDTGLIDIVREDFADGVSFQTINLGNDIVTFAQSYDGQSLVTINRKLESLVIRRSKESSHSIELPGKLLAILERNPQACSPTFGGALGISNDSRQCYFYAGNDELFYYIQRPHKLPSWMTIKLDWSARFATHQKDAGRCLTCRFIQTESGTTISSVASSYYTVSSKTGLPVLIVSSFLIRPLLDQAHFLSRSQCGEVKQFNFVFPLRSFGPAMVPNFQRGSLVSSISHTGTMLVVALNQNQAGFSASNSRLVFLGLHVRAVSVCLLKKILDDQQDFVTGLEWLRTDLLCAVCTARGRFAIFAAASGALRLVQTANDAVISTHLPILSDDQHTSIDLLHSSARKVLTKNRIATHVSEPVFMCFSMSQAGHVLLRNMPQRVRIIRDYLSAATEAINAGDMLAGGRLNLSAWGLVATCIEPFHDRQLNFIRQLSTQTLQICSSFIAGGIALLFEKYTAFISELRNLLGFCIYQEDSFSLLAETITLSLLQAFNMLLPSATTVKVSSSRNPSPEMLTDLYKLVNNLDNDIRQCYRHLDTTSNDVRNIHLSNVNEGNRQNLRRSKPPSDSFPALSWALNFYERLYLECCRQIIHAEGNNVELASRYRPLLQKIQACCALVCPIGKCVAALADFKVAPGVDNFLDGNIEGALRTWSASFIELQCVPETVDSQRNLILTSLFGLLTTDRVVEAVLLCDFVVLNIICPVRRKVEFHSEEDDNLAHIATFADCISGSSRLELLLGPFSNFVGSLAASLGRWMLQEPICIPPALQPRDVGFDVMTKTNIDQKDAQRSVCVDPSFVSKAESLNLLNPSRVMLEFLITGRYNDAIRFAQATGNSSSAITIALSLHLFSASLPQKQQVAVRSSFTPPKQVRIILESYTKPIDNILDFLFLLSALTSGTTNVNVSTLEDHVAVSSGAVNLTLVGLPKISEPTLSASLLLSTLCKKSATSRWTRTICDLLHKSCYPLSSIFFSLLLMQESDNQQKSVPSPIYCPQLINSIDPNETVLSMSHRSLPELHRKLTADLFDSFISGLKCSRTLNSVVAAWKRRFLEIWQAWCFDSDPTFQTLVSFEDPKSRLFSTGDILVFEDQVPPVANSSVEVLCEDFCSVLGALAFWHLVDVITINWNIYTKIIEDGANASSETILARETELIQGFACLLPLSLLLNTNQSGKSLCFDVIVKVASKFIACETLAKFFGYAAALLVEVYGDELYETFVNPRLEPLLDAWKGAADKTSGASLIYVYANQLKHVREAFSAFGRNSNSLTGSNFLANYVMLLLSSTMLSPFLVNLFNVRFNPVAKLSKCESLSEMLIPENWSSVMAKLLKDSKSGAGTLTSKALVASSLDSFLSNYPENNSFTGHLAVGNVSQLFNHMCAVIREGTVWKAGAGGRTIAELERRRGDSNMAEFYQLMRSADYPNFVEEIRAICSHISAMDFSRFCLNPPKSDKPLVEIKINPNLVVHVLWMREIRPSQEQLPPPELPQMLEDEDEENSQIAAAIGPRDHPNSGDQAKENVFPGAENVDDEDRDLYPEDVQSLWQNLKPKRGSDSSSSSSASASLTTTADLSHQPSLPVAPRPKVIQATRKSLSSSHSVSNEASTSRISNSVVSTRNNPQDTKSENEALETPQHDVADSITRVLELQANSMETILTHFSQQQTALITEMVTFVTSQRAGKSGHHRKDDPSSSSSSSSTSRKDSSSLSSISSLQAAPPMPKLLRLSCPTPAETAQYPVPHQTRRQQVLPRLLTLNPPEPGSSEFFSGENHLTEERMISVFKAAASFSGDAPSTLASTRLIPSGHFGEAIPPLIGVGMLRRFRVRKRQTPQTAEELNKAPEQVPTAQPVAVERPRVSFAKPEETHSAMTVYKATIGVNTEKLRMVSVGITASTNSVVTRETRGDQEDGIFDSLLQQSQQAFAARQRDFSVGAGMCLSREMIDELANSPHADIGMLNYLNRRPMPEFVPRLLPPQKILVSSATETDIEKKDREKGKKNAADEELRESHETYTKHRSGLDENLRLVNAESFAMLEQHLGLSPQPALSNEFMSVHDVSRRDSLKQNVKDAEAELQKLLESARKTIGWRSDQKTAQTQTEREKGEGAVPPDSWDHSAYHFDTGVNLISKDSSSSSDPQIKHDSAMMKKWSKRFDVLEKSGNKFYTEMQQIDKFSTGLLESSQRQKPKIPMIELNPSDYPPETTTEDELSHSQQLLNSEAVPPILKKSVSFSEASLRDSISKLETPRKPSKAGNQKSSGSPTTSPSTPHLDVVQLCDTGSLQPSRTPRTPKTPRTPHAREAAQPRIHADVPAKRHLMENVRLSDSGGAASSTTTTTPSEMKNTSSRRLVPQARAEAKKFDKLTAKRMQKRLDDASKLVAELAFEQEMLQKHSKDRWSQPSMETRGSRSQQLQSSSAKSHSGQSLRGSKKGRPTLNVRGPLSETDKREAAVLESHFRDILMGIEPEKQHAVRGLIAKRQHHRPSGHDTLLQEKKLHLQMLLEREADLAKPPSEPSEGGEGDDAAFADRLREVDPAVADLLDKYSVHSGSVFSIVDWGEVDKVLAQEGS